MKKIYLIVGIIVFIFILTASHILLNVKSSSQKEEQTQTVVSGENITHTGKFLIPVENYIKMTCKYRSKNTSNYKKAILSYRCGFSRK